MSTEQKSYSAIPRAEAVTATQMVEVIAPATLKEGFTFDATYQGVVFPVTVPPGGVTEGQTIIVPFTPTSYTTSGVWKDDMFAFTRYGICHPSFINACCCPLILLGQVMTRLKLDWLARPGRDWSQTFVIMIAITIVYAIVTTMLRPAVVVNYDDEVGMTTETETASPIYDMTTFVYGVFMLVVLTITRKVVRERYQIPETRCVGCEDVCCALWCGCCTVSQLARQTADYDVEDAQFFTPDGLASRQTTPVIIV